MKRIFSVALLGIVTSGITLLAQQTPSTTPSMPGQMGSTPQQESDTTNAHQSARSFEGKIVKSGGQLVLEDPAAQTSYRLDDQGKAKRYLGKEVEVMATMDSHSNMLRVIDITTVDENR